MKRPKPIFRDPLRLLPWFILLALLPVMLLRDYTPSNELRYLSIADEALAEGHIFAFACQGEPYADKPPLYLWIVMAGKLLFGEHRMGFLALFSLVPALLLVRTMDRWTRELMGRGQRLAAAFALATSGLFLGLAVVLRMDMLMCLFITLALRSFWRLHTGEGSARRERLLLPLYTFLALFTKGPVGLLVPIVSTLVYLAFARQLRTAGRYWGWRAWAVLLGGCALWFTAVWLEGGREYLDNLLFHQTVDRAVDAFHHKEPVWYYLVSVWYSLAPWSLLLAALFVAAARRRLRITPLERFFLCIVGSTFVMLSAFSSKIAVYLAPAFPFIVYLAFLFWQRIRPARNGWFAAAIALPALVWTAALPAVLLLPRHVEGTGFLADGRCIAAAALLTLTGLVAGAELLRRRTGLTRPIRTLAAGTFCALFVGGFALPRLNEQIGYGPLCRTARSVAAADGTTHYYVWRMHRPEAMDVYLGCDVEAVTTEEVLAGRCADGVLLLPERRLDDDPALGAALAGYECRAVGPHVVVRTARPPQP